MMNDQDPLWVRLVGIILMTLMLVALAVLLISLCKLTAVL